MSERLFCPHCGKEKQVQLNNDYNYFKTYICSSGKHKHLVVDFDNEDMDELYRVLVKHMDTIWKPDKNPTFTDHSPWHSARVLEIIEKLLLPIKGESTNCCLTKDEFFLLTVSAYLHDAAMQVVPDELTIEIGTGKINEYEFREKLRKKHSQNAPWASQVILEKIGNVYPNRSLMINKLFEPVEMLTKFHSGNEDYLKNLIFTDINNSLFNISKERLRLFAGILRIADELDLDERRVVDFHNHQGKHLPPESALHWLKHLIVERVEIIDQVITIYFRRPAASEESKDFYRKLGIWIKAKLLFEWYLLNDKEKLDYIGSGCKRMVNPDFPLLEKTFDEDFKENSLFKLPEHFINDEIWDKIKSSFIAEIDKLLEISEERLQRKLSQAIYGPDGKPRENKEEVKRGKIEKAMLLYARGDGIKAIEILKPLSSLLDDNVVRRLIANFEFDEGNYDDSISLYRKILKENPNNIDVTYDLGVAYLQNKEYDQAINSFNKIYKVKSKSPEILYSLAVAYSKKDQTEQAKKYFEQALKIRPNNSNTLCGLGANYGRSGDYTTAIKYFRRALKVSSDNYEALFNLGKAYANKGELYQAIKYFEKALAIKPDEPDLLEDLGSVYKKKGEFDRALDYFNQALVNKPNDPGILCTIGIAFFEKDDYIQGFKIMDQALKIDQSNPTILSNLGVANLKLQKYDKALDYLNQALVLKPQDPKILFDLSAVYSKLGNKDQAIKLLEQSLVANQDKPEVLYNLGILYMEIGEFDKATKYLKQVLKMEPDSAKAQYGLGITYSKKGDYEQAIEFFNRSLKKRPNDPDILTRLGIEYCLKSDYKQATNYFEKSLKIDSNNSDTLYNFGIVLARKGEYCKALELFEQIPEGDASYSNTIYCIACTYSLQGEREQAFRYLRQSIELDEKWRVDAIKDEDFRKYWDDEEFKRIVNSDALENQTMPCNSITCITKNKSCDNIYVSNNKNRKKFKKKKKR